MVCSIDSRDRRRRQGESTKLLKTHSLPPARRSAQAAHPTGDTAAGAHRLTVAAGRSGRRNHAAVDVADALYPTQRHGHIELPGENVDRRGDARLAAGAETVDVGASDHAG